MILFKNYITRECMACKYHLYDNDRGIVLCMEDFDTGGDNNRSRILDQKHITKNYNGECFQFVAIDNKTIKA